jgi:hypothetical protein
LLRQKTEQESFTQRRLLGADDAKVAKEATPEVPPMLVLNENGNPVPLVDLQGNLRLTWAILPVNM